MSPQPNGQAGEPQAAPQDQAPSPQEPASAVEQEAMA